MKIEEQWLRQGVKARRKRNQGRVQALESMRALYAKRRTVMGTANLSLTEAERSGQLVINAEHISYYYQQCPIVENFSLKIMRGDRIGIIGPNGSGKTTLLQLLLQELSPQEGFVHTGTGLKIAYFDQRRAQIDFEKTILDNVAEGREKIDVNGRAIHAFSYLQDFLFTPEQIRAPAKNLSGGERNRLLLARLFSKSANLLVMDEPTNDLDIETLELLEELLIQYQGTLLLVSHDRNFLDNVVTSVLIWQKPGQFNEYFGGYQDWQHHLAKKIPPIDKPKNTSKTPINTVQTKKLTYKQQQELKELPQHIEQLECKRSDLHTVISQTDFYQQSEDKRNATLATLAELDKSIESAYARWEKLEQLK